MGGVWLSSLLPALVLGPLAGAVADRLDRRINMIVGDVLRAALYLTIPLDLSIHFANPLTWVYVVQFLASCVSLFWTPAKDASMPNLVPPDRLEEANQYSLFTTFGTAPIAGIVFSLLSLVSRALEGLSHYFTTNPVNLALYFNAATFVVSALTIYALREIPKRQFSSHISAPAVARTIWEGWRFIGRTPVVRGLVIGMVGAFAAGGVVVGLGQPYITNTLHGGNAGWGVVFAAIFVGLAGGMFLGLRILNGFSRRRLFGLSIVSAAIPLALIALIPNLVVTVLLVVLLGACAGVAYVTGYTIVGLEVDDDTRGRTFAFLNSAIRVILFTVIAVAPFVAAGFTALIRGASGAGQPAHRPRQLRGDRLQLRDAAGRGDRGVGRRRLLPADGRPEGRAAARRPGVRGPGRGVPAGPRPRQRQQRLRGARPPGTAFSSRSRAVRGPARPPRPGCSRSGCVTRATTWSPPGNQARPRSACGCAPCCWTPRTPACRPAPRPCSTLRTGPST